MWIHTRMHTAKHAAAFVDSLNRNLHFQWSGCKCSYNFKPVNWPHMFDLAGIKNSSQSNRIRIHCSQNKRAHIKHIMCRSELTKKQLLDSSLTMYQTSDTDKSLKHEAADCKQDICCVQPMVKGTNCDGFHVQAGPNSSIVLIERPSWEESVSDMWRSCWLCLSMWKLHKLWSNLP